MTDLPHESCPTIMNVIDIYIEFHLSTFDAKPDRFVTK